MSNDLPAGKSKKGLWAIIIAAIAVVVIIVGIVYATSDKDDSDDKATTTADVPAAVAEPLKVALVTRITTGSWYETYARGVQSQVDAFGGSLQIYDSNNDLSKLASNVSAAVAANVNVLLINNASAEAAEGPVQEALDAGITVVTYDSDLTNDGLTAINQDDKALAGNGLAGIKEDFTEGANIAVLSVAGYPPLDRRLEVVDQFLADNPDFKKVATAGVVSGNAALDTQAQVEALLKANPNPGDIDVIWSHWNEFTRGAFEAIKTSGRTDVKVYSVDLTDQELPYFWDKGVDFQLASATNPATVGIWQVRLAYQKVAGEDPGAEVQVAPAVVRKSDLPENAIEWSALAEAVPAWNQAEHKWPDWIAALEAAN